MIAYIVLSIIIAFLFLGFHEKRTNQFCRSRRRLDGETVIVTGGTSGMGLEISVDLAERGARVIVACPYRDEGARGRKIIIERSGNENVVFKLLDLQSIESVRKFAKEIIEYEEKLNILINNAEIFSRNQFLTKYCMNSIMAVNYYGAFLLTLLLLPLLRKTGTPDEPARIVNTSSVLHNIGIIDFDNINVLNYWPSIRVYGNSKLCIIFFTRELAKRLKDTAVTVNSLDPGAVGTPIFLTYAGKIGLIVALFLKYFCKTPWEGAQTALHIALDKHTGGVSGNFFKNCAIRKANAIVYDDNIAAKLWEESTKLVRLDEAEIQDLLYGATG